jgi:hypothetical protein
MIKLLKKNLKTKLKKNKNLHNSSTIKFTQISYLLLKNSTLIKILNFTLKINAESSFHVDVELQSLLSDFHLTS